MGIISIGVLAVTAVILMLTLRQRNSEIALMLGISCSVMLLIGLLSQIGTVIGTVNGIVAAAGVNTGYIAILLKVIGICLVTEFAANTCRDAGSASLAANVSLAGKIFVTVTALPLYADIFNTVLSLLSR